MDKYFVGIEGGSTSSKLVVLSGVNGNILFRKQAGPTNPWLSFDESVSTVHSLVRAAEKHLRNKNGKPRYEEDFFTTDPEKESEKKPEKESEEGNGSKFGGIGLTLSGLGDKNLQKKFLKRLIHKSGGDLASEYFFGSDLIGPLETAFGPGRVGCVIISGTGSSSRLVAEDGTVYRSGGLGHLLGDEGSGFSTAVNAIKLILQRVESSFLEYEETRKFDISVLYRKMLNYFEITQGSELLTVFYRDFKKHKIAGFTKHIADAAYTGDPLAIYLLQQTGQQLGKLACSITNKYIKNNPNHPKINFLGVGSMWKSWEVIGNRFLGQLPKVPLRFASLKETSAIGAASFVARKTGLEIPINRENLIEVKYEN
ncbi:badf type atpase domain-containing protein [Anaeramoeba flamelloides]|uniref:N-acetyl-D-glucosamine kinase n=1 Tax=Anaeramoeba flamelloides TaxID=1746091 RepID=A0AAV7YNZ1_9EUKA|nr:badf type atpase domain-containing protein [Anaeramoeba flamelloides]